MLVTYTYTPPIVTRRYSLVNQRELGLEPSFDEPTVIHRQARAPLRAPPAHVRRAPLTTASPVRRNVPMVSLSNHDVHYIHVHIISRLG